MATPMELSLDDIISQTKKTGRGGGRGRGSGRGRGRGGVTRSGGFATARNIRTGGQRGRGSFRSRTSNADGVWTHDKFQETGFGGARAAGGLRTGGTGPAKITISNLHFGVSDADILELFGELGRIKYASVHYDRTGRSMGKADVVFERRSEAQLAIQQYNGVPLDGRAMAIAWAGAEAAAAASPTKGGLRQIQGGRINRTSAGGVRGRGRGGFRGTTRGRGAAGGGRGRGGGRGGGTPKTAAELDAELDAYIKQNPK
jgi:THO complex subunit 4